MEMSYIVVDVTPFPKSDSKFKIVVRPTKVTCIFAKDFSKSFATQYYLVVIIAVIISILAKSKVLKSTNNFKLKLGCSLYSNLLKLSLKVKTETC